MTDEPIVVGCSNCEELFNEDEMECIDGWWYCEACIDEINNIASNK